MEKVRKHLFLWRIVKFIGFVISRLVGFMLFQTKSIMTGVYIKEIRFINGCRICFFTPNMAVIAYTAFSESKHILQIK